ncbi:EamA family transporter [Patescibacteria group bacterium]|nr:EamA family transporter [Patescibacteria group bacterium]
MNDIIGALFIFSNVIYWSLYIVIGKKILKKYSAELVTSYTVIFGTLLMIPTAILWGNLSEITNLNLSYWISILYLGILGSFVGFFCGITG